MFILREKFTDSQIENQNRKTLTGYAKYKDYFDQMKSNLPFEFRSWSLELRKGYLEQGVSFLTDIHERNVDIIFFLDTSARSLALFFRELWHRIYPKEKVPELKFIVGDKGGVDFEKKMRSVTSLGLKSSKEIETDEHLVDRVRRKEKEKVEKIKETYKWTDFEDKIVLVVDEYVASGGTTRTIQRRLQQAFPNTKTVMTGAMYWDDIYYKPEKGYNDGPPENLDIKPPVLQIGDPCYYSNRKFQLGETLWRKVDEVRKPISDSVLAEKIYGRSKFSVSERIRMIGKYEILDKKSLQAADQAIASCIERGDEECAERARKIKENYLILKDTSDEKSN